MKYKLFLDFFYLRFSKVRSFLLIVESNVSLFNSWKRKQRQKWKFIQHGCQSIRPTAISPPTISPHKFLQSPNSQNLIAPLSKPYRPTTKTLSPHYQNRIAPLPKPNRPTLKTWSPHLFFCVFCCLFCGIRVTARLASIDRFGVTWVVTSKPNPCSERSFLWRKKKEKKRLRT